MSAAGCAPGRRVAVLGGGAAGIFAARAFAAGGSRVTLIETQPGLGGLHSSHMVDGCWYDIGTFIFHESHDYLRAFPGTDRLLPLIDYAPASLTPAGTLDGFPPSLPGYVRANGWRSLARDLPGIGLGKITCRRRDSLLDYIHYYLGRGVYVRSGLKNYIERLFALPDTEIDVEFAHRRLEAIAERCSLRRGSLGIARRMLGGRPAPPRRCRIRPAQGFMPLYGYIEAALRNRGIEVLTGTIPESIRGRPGDFSVSIGGRLREYDSIVSTIPMETTSALAGVPLPFVPRYVKLVSLFYRFTGDPGFSTFCLYNLTPSGPWKRLTLFSRGHGLHRGDHYFTVECTVPEEVEHSVEALRAGFEDHIAGYPVFRGRLRRVGAAVTPHAYPVYRAGCAGPLAAGRRALEDAGLILFGRQGQFDYAHSDELGLRASLGAWATPGFPRGQRPAAGGSPAVAGPGVPGGSAEEHPGP